MMGMGTDDGIEGERFLNYDRNDDAKAAPNAAFAARFLVEYGLQMLNGIAERAYNGEVVDFGGIAVRAETGTDAWEAQELVEKLLVDGRNPDWPYEFKTDYSMDVPHARTVLLWRLKDGDVSWPSDEEIEQL